MATFIEQYKKMYPTVLAVLNSEILQPYFDNWMELGKPQCWELVEVSSPDGYEVWEELRYEKLALFDSFNDIIVVGKQMLIHPSKDVVVLDKNYYATKKYLHIPLA